MKPNRQKAFTLVELLVVIAIIVLLVAMLMPTFGMVYNTMQRLHCQANLRAIHQVMVQYSHINEGHFPCLGGLTHIQEVSQVKTGVPDGGTAPPISGNPPTNADQHLMGNALKLCGATAVNFSCPLYPGYGDTNDPAWQTWTLFRSGTLNSCTYKIIDTMGYVFFVGGDNQQVNPNYRSNPYYPGLPAFAGAGTVRYDKFSIYPDNPNNSNGGPLNNKPFAKMLDDPQNPPLVADLMCLLQDSSYRGCNHCRLDDNGTPIEGGGSTLFLNGNINWNDWADLGGATATPPTQPPLDWRTRSDWWADECGAYYFASSMDSNTGN